jgi:hypothetical protein
LLYECVVDDAARDTHFEEKVIVFRFEEDGGTEDLLDWLRTMAKRHEVDYENVEGNMVRWLFREILEIQEISSYAIRDGTEVFFRWWDNPGPRAFGMMRRTHGHPWWPVGKGQYDQSKPRPKRATRKG